MHLHIHCEFSREPRTQRVQRVRREHKLRSKLFVLDKTKNDDEDHATNGKYLAQDVVGYMVGVLVRVDHFVHD